jgi:hypothetical protein
MKSRGKEPILRIGITGHRILAGLERIETAVDKALTQIQQAFPGRHPAALTALAEGADRIAARRIIRRPHSRLLVVLPMPQSEYMADFKTTESGREFLSLLNQADEVVLLPPATTRNAAYEAAGDYVLERCDVLLAIWDGKAAQGRGGTGAVVRRARLRGLPIAWIHAGNRKPGTSEPTTLGRDQGKITFENFQH